MKKVIFRGPTLTHSGYGVHARQIASWLLTRQDLDVRFMLTPWGDTPWVLNRSSFDGLVGKIMEKSVQNDEKCDVSLQLQLPNEWDPNIGKVNVGITASVETDKANPEWVQAINKMSMLIVPSKHALDSLTNVGTITVPHEIIAESFCDGITKSDLPKINLDSIDTKFNFLLFGQMTGNNPFNDRKNLMFAIKWICEAFSNDPDVGIIIKTNAGRNTKIDRTLVTKTLTSILKEVRSKTGFPKVHLMHGEMSEDEIAALYKHEKVKALVSLTRGEGFGLPILEAAASGLPVIVTGWSGHMDFMQHTKFINVDFSLRDVHHSRIDEKIFMKGSKWAEPHEDDFKKKIIKFRNASSIPSEWAKEGSKKILELYSQENIAKIYNDKLSDILK